MKKTKIVLLIAIITMIISIVLGYFQRQIITNQDTKIALAYSLLNDSEKQIISDTIRDAKIKKIKIKSSNRQFTSVNKEFYGKTVYAVTFPITDGRPETEFTFLCDLDITEIVGYGVLE